MKTFLIIVLFCLIAIALQNTTNQQDEEDQSDLLEINARRLLAPKIKVKKAKSVKGKSGKSEKSEKSQKSGKTKKKEIIETVTTNFFDIGYQVDKNINDNNSDSEEERLTKIEDKACINKFIVYDDDPLHIQATRIDVIYNEEEEESIYNAYPIQAGSQFGQYECDWIYLGAYKSKQGIYQVPCSFKQDEFINKFFADDAGLFGWGCEMFNDFLKYYEIKSDQELHDKLMVNAELFIWKIKEFHDNYNRWDYFEEEEEEGEETNQEEQTTEEEEEEWYFPRERYIKDLNKQIFSYQMLSEEKAEEFAEMIEDHTNYNAHGCTMNIDSEALKNGYSYYWALRMAFQEVKLGQKIVGVDIVKRKDFVWLDEIGAFAWITEVECEKRIQNIMSEQEVFFQVDILRLKDNEKYHNAKVILKFFVNDQLVYEQTIYSGRKKLGDFEKYRFQFEKYEGYNKGLLQIAIETNDTIYFGFEKYIMENKCPVPEYEEEEGETEEGETVASEEEILFPLPPDFISMGFRIANKIDDDETFEDQLEAKNCYKNKVAYEDETLLLQAIQTNVAKGLFEQETTFDINSDVEYENYACHWELLVINKQEDSKSSYPCSLMLHDVISSLFTPVQYGWGCSLLKQFVSQYEKLYPDEELTDDALITNQKFLALFAEFLLKLTFGDEEEEVHYKQVGNYEKLKGIALAGTSPDLLLEQEELDAKKQEIIDASYPYQANECTLAIDSKALEPGYQYIFALQINDGTFDLGQKIVAVDIVKKVQFYELSTITDYVKVFQSTSEFIDEIIDVVEDVAEELEILLEEGIVAEEEEDIQLGSGTGTGTGRLLQNNYWSSYKQNRLLLGEEENLESLAEEASFILAEEESIIQAEEESIIQAEEEAINTSEEDLITIPEEEEIDEPTKTIESGQQALFKIDFPQIKADFIEEGDNILSVSIKFLVNEKQVFSQKYEAADISTNDKQLKSNYYFEPLQGDNTGLLILSVVTEKGTYYGFKEYLVAGSQCSIVDTAALQIYENIEETDLEKPEIVDAMFRSLEIQAEIEQQEAIEQIEEMQEQVVENLEPVVELVQATRLCRDDRSCKNGGECVYKEEKNVYKCQCTPDYGGHKCQKPMAAIEKHRKLNRKLGQTLKNLKPTTKEGRSSLVVKIKAMTSQSADLDVETVNDLFTTLTEVPQDTFETCKNSLDTLKNLYKKSVEVDEDTPLETQQTNLLDSVTTVLDSVTDVVMDSGSEYQFGDAEGAFSGTIAFTAFDLVSVEVTLDQDTETQGEQGQRKPSNRKLQDLAPVVYKADNSVIVNYVSVPVTYVEIKANHPILTRTKTISITTYGPEMMSSVAGVKNLTPYNYIKFMDADKNVVNIKDDEEPITLYLGHIMKVEYVADKYQFVYLDDDKKPVSGSKTTGVNAKYFAIKIKKSGYYTIKSYTAPKPVEEKKSGVYLSAILCILAYMILI